MTAVLLGAAAVSGATLLGGVTGFGYGLVSMPLLLLVGFPLVDVVTANLIIGMLTRVAVVYRLREHIDRSRATILVVGSVPGIVVGYEVHDLVDATTLKVGAGMLAMIFAVYLAVRPPAVGASGSRIGGLAAGASGGFLGVTTSLNGVPAVLWLSRVDTEPLGFIADLAVYFVVDNLIAVPLLLMGGEVSLQRLGGLLLVWVPCGLAGNAVGLRLAPRVPRRMFRLVTLGLVIVAGAATLVTAW
jgi:uncharacterized protein